MAGALIVMTTESKRMKEVNNATEQMMARCLTVGKNKRCPAPVAEAHIARGEWDGEMGIRKSMDAALVVVRKKIFANIAPVAEKMLVRIPMKVNISGGELETLQKKDGIIIETVSGADEIKVIYWQSSNKTIKVPYHLIQSFHEQPNPSRDKGLMVIAQNHPEHIALPVPQYITSKKGIEV
ncbi:hypothetical protein BDP27DRAFT_1364947 [Rhodocollybia butyracea]|uniref:Uncharacterized protein n=1 Tax=Rhodocollybia butyracea TaxID=206335 RepID=A0A9P5PQ13_9AGAR|nr:hypothetical protein BDP27DRAFT_1364947 [Rhodocollybia butyracea]